MRIGPPAAARSQSVSAHPRNCLTIEVVRVTHRQPPVCARKLSSCWAVCHIRARRNTAITTRTIHEDRKSTRLNSSHVKISYAVFCLKKKKHTELSQSTKRPSDEHA